MTAGFQTVCRSRDAQPDEKMHVRRNRIPGAPGAGRATNERLPLPVGAALACSLVIALHPRPARALHSVGEPGKVKVGSESEVTIPPADSGDPALKGEPAPPPALSDGVPQTLTHGAPDPGRVIEPIEIVEQEQLPANDPPPSACDLPLLSDAMPRTCSTPRYGTLSGGFLGLDVGFGTPARRAAEQAGIGPGLAVSLRLGFELWDTLVLSVGLSDVVPADKRPSSEVVVECRSDVFGTEICDTKGYAKDSEIRGGWAASFEAGLQHRFRPWSSLSLSPGLMLGYAAAFGPLNRGVTCDGCAKSTNLPFSVSGAYTAPFLRVTFGHMGMYAAVVRSAWFFSGDMRQTTTLGIEVFAP